MTKMLKNTDMRERNGRATSSFVIFRKRWDLKEMNSGLYDLQETLILAQ